jgi:Arc/MetJ-type ribon-helix-helix transcriptional regulator
MVKVSVSLPDADVDFLDPYGQAQRIESRSAVVHKAVGLLRAAQLADAYEHAWDSWEASDEASAWEAVTADGLGA